MFTFERLALPVVQAPMAGGPSTPDLAAAVSNAGGLGFLAAGYLTAAQLHGDIARTRTLTAAPFGVNLFAPQTSVAKLAQIEDYRSRLEPDAARYDIELPELIVDGSVSDVADDDWHNKIAVLEADAPSVVSFTFGLPAPEVLTRLHALDVCVVATVTSVSEAIQAIALGVDALCVQGPGAGGHRGTFDPAAALSTQPLERLLESIAALTDMPLIATGGVASSADVRHLLDHGAVAVQCGTAFLKTVESGTRPAHRAAIGSPDFPDTTVTRAFTGRAARALVNRFVETHDATAPLGYPEVGDLTAPLRAAANAAGDAHGLALWAGTGHRLVREGTAAQIVAMLSPAPTEPIRRD
ncbi:MAG: nitronate monooxygenase [Cryobacterium sp.]